MSEELMTYIQTFEHPENQITLDQDPKFKETHDYLWNLQKNKWGDRHFRDTNSEAANTRVYKWVNITSNEYMSWANTWSDETLAQLENLQEYCYLNDIVIIDNPAYPFL